VILSRAYRCPPDRSRDDGRGARVHGARRSELELVSSPANNELRPGPRAASPHRGGVWPAAGAERRAPARTNHRPCSPSASSPVGLDLAQTFWGSIRCSVAVAGSYRLTRALEAARPPGGGTSTSQGTRLMSAGTRKAACSAVGAPGFEPGTSCPLRVNCRSPPRG